MQDNKKKKRDVVFITGASSGIGKAVAELFMKKGYVIYGTTRKHLINGIITQTCQGIGILKTVQMDIRSDDSIKSIIDMILREEGKIDILVNNAGIGIAGSVEDTTTDEIIKQFDTNFYGTHRVLKQVIPVMRSQGSGRIINISSVAAEFPIPFQSMYSASKAAIEALSMALRAELKPFGIKVSTVEPGDTKTGFTDSRIFVEGANDQSVYKDKFTKSINVMIKDEKNGLHPEEVAEVVCRIARRKSPPVKVIAGTQYKVFVFLKRFLPTRLVNYVVSKMY